MSHWYNQEGYLYGPVTTKAGGFRDFDLRDARKVAALPSVTTILNLLSKPGLYPWQMMQVAKAAWEQADSAHEVGWDNWSHDVIRGAGEYTRYTQDFGTATHWWLNKKLRAAETVEIPPMIPGAEEVADALTTWLNTNGYEFTHTEHRFARTDMGYAGTVDLLGTHWGVPCIVDLKTQEPPLTPYLGHGLQLAGYDYALPIAAIDWDAATGDRTTVHRERISLIANRANPGEVKAHLWVDKGSTVEATNARYDKMFLLLRDFWFLSNNYDPRGMDADPD